jgi:hypothetical protein
VSIGHFYFAQIGHYHFAATPFVGAVAACLAIAEVLRLLHGGTVHELIDLDLQAVEHRSTVAHTLDFSGLNPGYVLAANIA